MGQYFYPLLTKGNKKATIRFYGHDYDNGVKLLEHSYFGNQLVFAAFMKMYNNPWRVAWIGDYSDGMFTDDCEGQRWSCIPKNETAVDYIKRVSCGFIKSADDFMKYYAKSNGIWDKEKEVERGLCKTERTSKDILNTIWTCNRVEKKEKKEGELNWEWVMPNEEMFEFLRNIMIHCYLINKTRKEYINCERWYKECVGSDYDRDRDGEHYAFHPLPLLTACGNDLGGGDFHQGGEYNCKYIGYWAFNNLYFANEPPKDYKEAEYLYEDFEAVPFS